MTTPVAQCVQCYAYFNPNANVGTWQCRIHAADSMTPDPSNPAISHYPCCGLTLEDQRVGIRYHYVHLREHEIRGCLAADHMSLEEAMARKFIVKGERKARPRFLDDMAILPVDVTTQPREESVLVDDLVVSLDQHVFQKKVPVAWPVGAVSDKDFTDKLEEVVRDTYATAEYQDKTLPQKSVILKSREKTPIHPSVTPGGKPLPPEEIEKHEALYGEDAKLLDEVDYLARYLSYNRPESTVRLRLVRRVAPSCDPETLRRVAAVKHLK